MSQSPSSLPPPVSAAVVPSGQPGAEHARSHDAESEVTSGGRRGRAAGRLVASLALAAAFIWLLDAGGLPLWPADAALAKVRWWTVGLYLVLWSVVHLLRAARWQLLLRPLSPTPFGRVLSASFIGFLAIVVLPLRAGEFVRPLMVRRRGELSAWAALGTIGAERIVDGLVLCLMLLGGLLSAPVLEPLPDRLGDLPIRVAWIPAGSYAALVLFAAAFCLMLAFYRWREATERGLRTVVGWGSERAAGWIAERASRLSDGFRFLATPRHSVPFVLATIAYWLLNSLATQVLGWGVGLVDFSFAQACVLTGVLALGILVPNAPGFFGAYQFSLYGALALFYPEAVVRFEGAALVLLLYVAQTAITLVFALAAWGSGGTSSWWSAGFGRQGSSREQASR